MDADSIDKLFVAASQLHQAGNLHSAEQGYRQVLAAHPGHSDAWHRLGVLAAQLGQATAAVELIRRAIAIAPDIADYHSNLAMALDAADEREQAVIANQHALKLAPEMAETHFNLGVVYEKQSQLELAALSYERAIALQPTFLEAHVNLGNVRKSQGQLESAADRFRVVLSMAPHSPEAYYNLAAVLHLQHRLDESVMSYRKAIELRPDLATAHNNLGNVLSAQGRYEEAAACFQRATTLDPRYADGFYNLGVALNALDRTSQAAAAFQQAIDLCPEHAESHYYLGCLLKGQGQPEAALEAYRRALAFKPGYGESDVLNLMQQICLWTGQEEIAHRLIRQLDSDDEEDSGLRISPLAFLGFPIATSASQQLVCARRWSKAFQVDPSRASTSPSVSTIGEPKPRIRIGYLSADFRSHPVGYLIPEWLESHDRAQFEIFGYSLGPDDESEARRRLRKAFDHFVDLHRLSHADAAMRIKSDQIDILVDLQGHTQQSRPQILAYRPASIQVNYLGFAATMGADFIDYILVDDFVVPSDQQPYFSERIAHLPGCFMVNDSRREIASSTPSRLDVGLPNDGLVLCGFSTSYKITPRLFDVWCRLLQAVDRSVLWLRADNAVATANLRREADRRGIAGDRIVFAPTVSMPEHLARHRLADLFLDTFPYNQHSSASDAIRMGVPMVTLSGTTFASRVAGSLLRAVGLSELVTHRFDDYERLVLRLANQPDELAGLRRKLADHLRSTDLYDGAAFAKKIEQAYRVMIDSLPSTSSKS